MSPVDTVDLDALAGWLRTQGVEGRIGKVTPLAGGTQNVVLRIEKVNGDDVDVRLVHPLAEKDIKFSAEVVQVSDPRPPPMPVQALDLEEEP